MPDFDDMKAKAGEKAGAEAQKLEEQGRQRAEEEAKKRAPEYEDKAKQYAENEANDLESKF